jgi:carbamoyl-phosphate synthase large subunit
VSLKESDPVLPRNLTGMAKFAHEIELRFIDAFCSDRFTTVCARSSEATVAIRATWSRAG